MKVLLTNSRSHKEGCTYTVLCEGSKALNKNGNAEFFEIFPETMMVLVLRILYAGN